MRSRNFWLLAVLVVTVFGGQAIAQTVTGCVDSKGGLKNVAVGNIPLSPCGSDQTEVTLGTQGPAGLDGADGTYLKEVILGPSGIPRDGANVSLAVGDCQSKFGPGARPANTKDLKELAWDAGSGFTAGWVKPYPVSRDANGVISDISGSSGSVEKLACGIANLNNLGIDVVWASTASGRLGLVASRANSRPYPASCNRLDIETLCVGPEPQP